MNESQKKCRTRVRLNQVFIDSLFYMYSNPNPSFPFILTQNLRRVRVRITNMYGLGLELRRGLGLGEEICMG